MEKEKLKLIVDSAKLKLIVAAEAEFAENGYAGSSVRGITQRAGMNVASVNYHFSSKESLFKEMFSFRVGPVNKLRIQLLRELREEYKEEIIPIDRLAEIIVRPIIERIACADSVSRNVIIAVNRFMSECKDLYREIEIAEFGEICNEIILTMQRCYPDLEKGIIMQRLHFCVSMLIGSMSSASSDGKHFHWLGISCDINQYIEGIITAATGILSGGQPQNLKK